MAHRAARRRRRACGLAGLAIGLVWRLSGASSRKGGGACCAVFRSAQLGSRQVGCSCNVVEQCPQRASQDGSAPSFALPKRHDDLEVGQFRREVAQFLFHQHMRQGHSVWQCMRERVHGSVLCMFTWMREMANKLGICRSVDLSRCTPSSQCSWRVPRPCYHAGPTHGLMHVSYTVCNVRCCTGQPKRH